MSSNTSGPMAPYTNPRSRGSSRRLLVIVSVCAIIASVLVGLYSWTSQSRQESSTSQPPISTASVAAPPKAAVIVPKRAQPVVKCIADRLTELGDQRAAYLAEIKASGATCVRIDIEWRAVEKSPPKNGVGSYDYADFDDNVAAIHAAGLEPHLNLDYAPWWAAGRRDPNACMGGEICSPLEAHVSAYGAFSKATAQHYNQPQFGEVRVYEIWNEPNFELYWPQVDPALYLKFFVSAKQGLRLANPEAIVITGGLTVAGDQAMLPVDFLNGMYTAGLHQHLDASTKIGFHPYTNGAMPGQDDAQDGWSQMVLSHGVLESNGDDAIGFWITEVAWSTNDVSPSEQAALVAEMFRLLRTPDYSWIEVVTWYTYRDNDKGMGLVAAEKSKPALSAYIKAA